MNTRKSLIAVSIALALGGTALAQTPVVVDDKAPVVVEEKEIRSIVTDAGYGDPVLIQQEDELWRVQSVNGSGDDVTLFVTAEGEVLGAAEVARTRITTVTDEAPATTVVTRETVAEPVTEATVATAIRDAGFHNVHDIDYQDGDGVWKAEADDITGEDFELHVDANTGQIVHVEDD